MNQPDDSEYEIQEPKYFEPNKREPKQIEPLATSHFEDEYSLEETEADRGKPQSWATRAIGLLLATLTLNGIVSSYLFSGWIFNLPTYLYELNSFLSFVCPGLFVCQYGAIWVWLKLYRSGWLLRAVLSSSIVAAVTLSGTINLLFSIVSGPFRSGNPWPEVMLLSCIFLPWAGAYYWMHSRLLGLLLKRTDLTLEFGLQGSNQYTIRRLLGWMMVFAIVSMVLKYLTASGMSMDLGFIAICAMWTVLSAFFSALIIYTQFASRFALERRKFHWYWWILVVISPPVYLGCALSFTRVLTPTLPSVEPLSDLAYTYLMDLGFAFGTWIQLSLIPKRGF
ncbi:MAG: hypothetical protein LW850_01980 [Planctomycetaceae bacterium]|nr:hypothetical protein [Planctomycetaceae bacterium]